MREAITAKALEIGFDKIGFAPADTLEEAGKVSREAAAKGYFADCDYLEKNIPLRVNPQLLLKNASTIITVAVNYFVPVTYENEKLKIAHFAFGTDYHIIVKAMMLRLASFIRSEFGAKVFLSLDGGRVFEKLWAERCGIGWQGKNSLIITPEFGSYVFLGVLISNLKISSFDSKAINRCGTCRRCIEACPNGAITDGKVIDIRRCIAYRTIEMKTESGLDAHSRNFCGCDICQNVCPHNSFAKPSRIKEFYPRRAENVCVSPEFIRNSTAEELLNIYSGTPVERSLRNRKLIGDI